MSVDASDAKMSSRCWWSATAARARVRDGIGAS
jgi:hypothetical protein